MARISIFYCLSGLSLLAAASLALGQSPEKKPALIVVYVKSPNAEVGVEGARPKNKGGIERRFQTEPIELGKEYSYEVSVTERIGKVFTRPSADVKVLGGKTTVVDFRKEPPSQRMVQALAAAQKAEPEPEKKPASIVIRVPTEDVKLFFGEQETKQRGLVRRFTTPPLAPGFDYTYEVFIEYRERVGKAFVGRSMGTKVAIRAGETKEVDFVKILKKEPPPQRLTEPLERGKQSVPGEKPAIIVVRVPREDTILTFTNPLTGWSAKTKPLGLTHQLQTQPLTPGIDYKYRLKIFTRERVGRPFIGFTIEVVVRAGKTEEVDLKKEMSEK